MKVKLTVAYNFTPESTAVFNILKATLEYPAPLQAKSQKLADDILFCCTWDTYSEPPLWEIWPAVIRVASSIPPGHELQKSLLLALNILRQRSDPAIPGNDLSLWKTLPDFSLNVLEYWNGFDNPTNHPDVVDEELARWKNFNSFLAQHCTTEYGSLAVWELQGGLEEPPAKAQPFIDCKVWVASEWITHCANFLFQVMKDGSGPGQEQITETVGKLCGDIPPQSLQRWEFWKKRISELAANPSSLQLQAATAAKLSEALKAMESLEK